MLNKLNIGCGEDIREGWCNVDIRKTHPSVITAEADALPFRDASFSEVLANDILEHFTIRELPAVLEEWGRVMKPGADIRIRTPNLDNVIRMYTSGWITCARASAILFGGQDYGFNFHKVIFNPDSVTKLLGGAGLTVTAVTNRKNQNMDILAHKV